MTGTVGTDMASTEHAGQGVRQQESAPRRTSRLPQPVLLFFRTRLAGFGLFVFVALCLAAATADVVAPYRPSSQDYSAVLARPSASHWMGTDEMGRDVLSRVLHGSRVSLAVGLLSVLLSVAAGVIIGLCAGFRGGWIDEALMRLVDAVYSFPALLLALAIAAALGPSLFNAVVAIAVVYTPSFARLVRGQVLTVRERDFVSAVRALGGGPVRIVWRHIWPNVTAPIIVQASLSVSFAIITEAALSFLGVGVRPPTAAWGSMLRNGYPYMERAAWLAFFPGAAIFVTVLGLNFLGDGLRVALDPRLRRRG
jgi:peptide/nickel transport system permease protein